jgi:hypothetical protein
MNMDAGDVGGTGIGVVLGGVQQVRMHHVLV